MSVTVTFSETGHWSNLIQLYKCFRYIEAGLMQTLGANV